MIALATVEAHVKWARELLLAIVLARKRGGTVEQALADEGIGEVGALFTKLVLGRRRPGEKVARALVAARRELQKDALETEINEAYRRWRASVEEQLRVIAIPPAGKGTVVDGQTLLARFRRATRKVRVETRLRHGISFLEDLGDRGPVWETEVAARQGRSKPKQEFLRTPPGLSTYPVVYKMWRGAVERLASKEGSDWEAQVVISCRRALEAMCMAITGEAGPRWKSKLNDLPMVKRERNVIRSELTWLNECGSHGDHTPTTENAIEALQRTSLALMLLLKATKQ